MKRGAPTVRHERGAKALLATRDPSARTFKESDDVGKSLAVDRRKRAKTKVKPGYGDQGDQPKRATKKASRKPAKKR